MNTQSADTKPAQKTTNHEPSNTLNQDDLHSKILNQLTTHVECQFSLQDIPHQNLKIIILNNWPGNSQDNLKLEYEKLKHKYGDQSLFIGVCNLEIKR